MFTAVVNTSDLAREVRLVAFGALMVVILIWVGRGDPRLTQAVAPQRRVQRGSA
jgi:hypothetical protein